MPDPASPTPPHRRRMAPPVPAASTVTPITAPAPGLPLAPAAPLADETMAGEATGASGKKTATNR